MRRVPSPVRWVLAGLLAALIAYVCVAMTRADARIAAVWPLNAVFLIILLSSRDKNRLKYGLAMLLGNAAANLLIGDAPAQGVSLALANVVEVAVVMRVIAPRGRVRLMRRAVLLRLAIAAAVGSLASSAIAALVLGLNPLGQDADQLLVWFAADFLGLLLFTPAIWSARAAFQQSEDMRPVLQAWPELLLVAAISVCVFCQSEYPLLFLVPPSMILLAFRRSFLAAIAGLVLMAVIAFVFTVLGYGPTSLITGDLQARVLVLQLFLAANTFMTLLMAASITQRRRSESGLKSARHRLRTQLTHERRLVRQAELAEDLSAVGYWSVDTATREVYWSPQVFQIHGVEPGAYTPTLDHALDFYVEKDLERVSALVAQSMERGEGWGFEASIRRTDGEIRRVRSRADIDIDASGAVSRIFGVLQDVTLDYRQMEEIREKEALYRLLADNASDLIARYTPDGRFTYLSPSCEKLLGYRPEELVGRRTYDVILPEDVENLHADWDAGLKSKQPFAVQYRARRKDGQIIVLEARPSIDKNAAGEIVGFFDVVRDVTDREQRERDLAHARQEAEDAARVKADFLSNMSHEIRTPLNGVLGFVSLLKDTPLNDEQARYVDRVSTAGSGLLAVVNDVLDFSRIEAKKMRLEDTAFSLADTLEQVVDVVRAAYPSMREAISLDLDGELPAASMGDPHRLTQILTNLVGNAAKFADGGDVAVSARLVGDQVEIRVKDDGPGIAPERLELVFDAFAQADSSVARKFGGTGLGLSISRSLARLMGGDLRLESELGVGTTATLILPSRPADPEALNVSTEAASAPRGLNVMVVDDQPMNRELIEIGLRRAGHWPRTFASAAEAIDDLAADPEGVDVILMDVQMPDVDGLEATRRIRRLGGPASTKPIIALTANVMAEQVEQCRAAGMDDHLGKPVDFQQLQAKLGAIAEAPAFDPDDAPSADPFADLRRRYVDHLGEEAQRLASLIERGELDDIARVAHTLAGTAGSLGFETVSESAFAAETAVKSGLPQAEALAAADELRQVMLRACA